MVERERKPEKLRLLDELPQPVRCTENIWVTLRDGTQLAARLWLPLEADAHPVPAIVEYIPYRKRDLTRARDGMNHPYLAAHGYACLRVDLRGSGDSEGVLEDQFLLQEQQDGYDVIEWIAAQEWCNGRVGMFGISWGGFAGLQVAAQQPPSLGAVVAASPTDDLYVDNMHYMGGCLLGDNLSEATTMLAFNSCPPDPDIVGARWRDMWLERLEGSGLWLRTWLEHQHRDDYWKVGSVRDDYAAVRCPVLCASGWADGYSNAVLRLLEHLPAHSKGLIGPWSHVYPHLGVPGPAIGFLQESLRWFDAWLKDQDNGVADEPRLRVWMQDSVAPQHLYAERPGRWIAASDWPCDAIHDEQLRFGEGRLLVAGRDQSASQPCRLQSPLTVGLFAGKWCSYPAAPDLPGDQRMEDGGALVFETEDLPAPVEILGRPRVQLELAADRPVAMVAVRLSDVLPDGQVTRVTYGLLNLTHRDGHAHPQPLEPGRRYTVALDLNGVAQHFPAGHRIRISVSTSYWPLAWPPPEPVTLTLWPEACHVSLPVRTPQPVDSDIRQFPPPQAATPPALRHLAPSGSNWSVHHDLGGHGFRLEVTRDAAHYRIAETGTEIEQDTRETYESHGNDFASVRGETRTLRAFRRGDWRAETRSRTTLRCDREFFYLAATLDAWDDDDRVFAQSWQHKIPRKLV